MKRNVEERTLKRSGYSGFDDENGVDMRDFSVRLPAEVADWIEHVALNEDTTVDQLLRELITKTVKDQAEPVEVRVRRIDELVKKMGVLVKRTPMKEEKDAKTGALAHEERKKKRDHLIELGMEACDELSKISRSEEAAKEADFRLQAFMAMARLGSFSAAVIRNQETEDLTHLIEELEETDERLKADLKKREKGRREKEEEEKERWRTAAI